jgi:hypothetical protein
MINAATCGKIRIEAFIRGAAKVETCSDKEPPQTSGKQFEELESLLPATGQYSKLSKFSITCCRSAHSA